MELIKDIMRYWGMSMSEAIQLAKRYELLGELEDLQEIVLLKESISNERSLNF